MSLSLQIKKISKNFLKYNIDFCESYNKKLAAASLLYKITGFIVPTVGQMGCA